MIRPIKYEAKISKANFTAEDWDSFLKENYGYRLWSFAASLAHVYTLYSEKKELKVYQYIEQKTAQLENIKEAIIKFIEDSSIYMDFCKQLSHLYSSINTQIVNYNYYKHIFKPYLYDNQSFNISMFPLQTGPLKLLVLIWGLAMKKNKRIDWMNMVELINWFSGKLKRIRILISKKGMLNLSHLKKFGFLPTEFLRVNNWNKYKNSRYMILARIIFDALFKEAKGQDKIDPSRVLDNIKKNVSRFNVSFERWKIILDLAVQFKDETFRDKILINHIQKILFQ